MNFKFAPPKQYRDIFTPGKLTALMNEIESGTDRKEYKGLTVDEFSKVPSLYSSFDPREISVLDLEKDKIYITKDKKEIFGADIKAITLLMYNRPRSAYIDFGRVKQCYESIYSGAVPYPLLGFKRFFGINYDSFRLKFSGVEITDEYHILGGLEEAFRLDLLLGNTFASTYYNVEEDQIEWKNDFGLLLLGLLNYNMSAEEEVYLRVKSMGNYRGSPSTSYGSVKVKYCEELNSGLVDVYNIASKPMRLMMLQRWVWYGNHRCSDMICSATDWNAMPPKSDNITNVFTGLKPKGGLKGIFDIS